ncbi:MAG TPA: 6-carboxytetrahydropterin synthase [Chthonomonadaceae bacterium]|nr:6-carboxytetrahydropterin synthase [Chthonomonadaceae bacterium]
MITMTRRVMFSAAHADWLASLSRADNEARFGPEASPEPYGHNYVLDVTVAGEIDPQTGIVVNIKEIDRIVRERVVQPLDKKFINKQVPAFCERPVTAETLVAFIASELAPHLPPAVTLTALRLEQTPLHAVEWLAEEEPKEPGSMLSTRVYEFAASHRLYSPHLTEAENDELFGKCAYLHGHGHNYVLEVTVAGPLDPCTGRVIEDAALDMIVHQEVVDRYDHRHFNYIPEFENKIPSSEVITRTIWERLRDHIPPPARLYRVVLRETARNIFEYRGEEDPT